MDFIVESFRNAGVILNEDEFIDQFSDVMQIISDISDEDLINKHLSYGEEDEEKLPKSLSPAINSLLKEQFISNGWSAESGIFQDRLYKGNTWRLDFARDDISIEVAFNHASAIAWNLTKPVLASELNHVEKAIQTKIGIIITATNDMKVLGGFDSAIGTFEKFLDYLPPLRNMLTVPLFIIGLKPPTTFKVVHEQYKPRKKIGRIEMYDGE